MLVDEEGDVGETLPIGGWTEDTIVEYLADTIGAAAAAKDATCGVAGTLIHDRARRPRRTRARLLGFPCALLF